MTAGPGAGEASRISWGGAGEAVQKIIRPHVL